MDEYDNYIDLSKAKKNCKEKSISTDEIIVPNVGVYDRSVNYTLKQNKVLREFVQPQ